MFRSRDLKEFYNTECLKEEEEILRKPQILKKSEFKKISNDYSIQEKGECFNNDSTFNKDTTKLVIVGTITPPHAEYFYCSSYNRIYGYIDYALRCLNRNGERTLKELKRGLQEIHNKKVDINSLSKSEIKNRVEEIKNILKKNNIAFLDAMGNVIRKPDSPYDKDIKFCTLATDDFKEVLSCPEVKIIVNSKLAKEYAEKIGLKNTLLLSQRFNKKEEWIREIISAIKR